MYTSKDIWHKYGTGMVHTYVDSSKLIKNVLIYALANRYTDKQTSFCKFFCVFTKWFTSSCDSNTVVPLKGPKCFYQQIFSSKDQIQHQLTHFPAYEIAYADITYVCTTNMLKNKIFAALR